MKKNNIEISCLTFSYKLNSKTIIHNIQNLNKYAERFSDFLLSQTIL